MTLEFKPDFARAAAHWESFWRDEHTRPPVAAVIPRAGVRPVSPPVYASAAEGDYRPVIDRLLAWAETHEFLAEAIPFFYLEFAANHFAALLGADLVFDDAQPGGWAVPFVSDLRGAELRFQPEGRWWRRTVEFAQALRERCDGKLLIAANTMVGNLDALAAVYGSEPLLLAMVEQPAAVHRALGQIDRAHGEILEALAALLGYDRFGSINRHGLYCRGRVNIPQCDFSCMISPAMFREFALPYLAREFARFDAGEYHLDGPGAIAHLEALCSLEDLDLIQWQPGEGSAQAHDWTSLFARIDALGKGQARFGDSPAQAAAAWRRYRSRKMFFSLRAESRAAVEDCLAALEASAGLKPPPGEMA